MSIIEIEYDLFEQMFEPIKSGEDWDGITFETYGKDLERIKNTPEQYVWTMLAEGEVLTIVNGYAYVDRFAYIITKNPWTLPVHVRYANGLD